MKPAAAQGRERRGGEGSSPAEHRVRVNGVELALFEWGGPARRGEPTILLAHATGFHARCWDAVIRRLGDRHAIAADQRGHGRSEKTAIAHWEVFGADLAGLVRALDLRDVLGVGHSMGGYAMVDAAASCHGRFRSLMLIDPVIASPEAYGAGGWNVSGLPGGVHPTAKRRRRFRSPAAMIDRFRDRVPYCSFASEVLRDYCVHGLLAAGDGNGFILACPPEIEASIYMTGRGTPGVHASARSLEIPVLILRAKLPPPEREVMDFSSSPTWPDLVREFRHGREVHFPEHSHFLPMEMPGRIAELILAEARAPRAPRRGGEVAPRE